MRFYDVNSGYITVSDTPIKEITRSSLRNKYGMVLQDTWLSEGTINENISYGNPNATQEQIIAAAKAAHAHSFIKRLPDGYNTKIGEGGASLSQGQRQLLCIARIMLCEPEILILDEATSSIDTRTEMRIQKAFKTAMRGKTAFIVAHRLSTITSADIILVMNKGQIIEQGSHQELLKKKKEGLLIEIVLDDNTKNRNADFDLSEEFSTYWVSIESLYKNIMHDKFCIIDLYTVVHGTFNWTKAANYNKETISIDRNRTTAESFADEFMKLKKQGYC